MWDVLDRAVKSYAEAHDSFYLYENGYKWGSENWLATIYYEKLKSPVICKRLQLRNISNARILVIDDCIHSGGNLGRTVRDMLLELKPVKERNVHIDIICAYGAREGCEYVASRGDNITLFIGEYLPDLVTLAESDNFKIDWRFINRICYRQYMVKFVEDLGEETDEPFDKITTVWFEHKLPAFNSCISGILSHILESEPDRSIVEESIALKDKFRYLDDGPTN
jgi:hypoxanthine phosphoribosyltransferase